MKSKGVNKIIPRQLLSTNVKLKYYWENRNKNKHVSFKIDHTLFTFAELLINDGLFSDLKPEEDFGFTFDVKDEKWLIPTNDRIMFIDLHKEGLDIMLFRDSDFTLKLIYSSPYYINRKIVYNDLKSLRKDERHQITLLCSSKGVFLFLDGKIVGSFQ